MCPVGAVRRGRGPARQVGGRRQRGNRRVGLFVAAGRGGRCRYAARRGVARRAARRRPRVRRRRGRTRSTRRARTPRWTGCCGASTIRRGWRARPRWYARFLARRGGSLRRRAAAGRPGGPAGAVRQAALPRPARRGRGAGAAVAHLGRRATGARLGRRAGADARSRAARGCSSSRPTARRRPVCWPSSRRPAARIRRHHLGRGAPTAGEPAATTPCGCGATRTSGRSPRIVDALAPGRSARRALASQGAARAAARRPAGRGGRRAGRPTWSSAPAASR